MSCPDFTSSKVSCFFIIPFMFWISLDVANEEDLVNVIRGVIKKFDKHV